VKFSTSLKLALALGALAVLVVSALYGAPKSVGAQNKSVVMRVTNSPTVVSYNGVIETTVEVVYYGRPGTEHGEVLRISFPIDYRLEVVGFKETPAPDVPSRMYTSSSWGPEEVAFASQFLYGHKRTYTVTFKPRVFGGGAIYQQAFVQSVEGQLNGGSWIQVRPEWRITLPVIGQ
jgi:hypothetical protein